MGENTLSYLSLDAGRAEDRETFAEIVRRYRNVVMAMTFSMTGNLQQSEDLAQETFVAAWQRLTDGETRPELAAEKIGPWLCGIARNLTNNWLRRTTRERKSQHVPVEENAIPDSLPSHAMGEAESEISREAQAALLWETLRHIPANYREPLVLFYQKGASIREIAATLDLTEACVKQRISRGRAMLKEDVAGRYESFLAKIRPGEHFVAAVLAAIPILACSSTGNIVVAETALGSSMTVAVGTTAKSSGVMTLTGIMSCLFYPCMIVSYFLYPLYDAWRSMTASPNLAMRRHMIFTHVCFYTMVYALMILQIYTNGAHIRGYRGGALGFQVLIVCSFCYFLWKAVGERLYYRKYLGESAESSILQDDNKSYRRLRRFTYASLAFCTILFFVWFPLFYVGSMIFGHLNTFINAKWWVSMIPFFLFWFFLFAVNWSFCRIIHSALRTVRNAETFDRSIENSGGYERTVQRYRQLMLRNHIGYGILALALSWFSIVLIKETFRMIFQ